MPNSMGIKLSHQAVNKDLELNDLVGISHAEASERASEIITPSPQLSAIVAELGPTKRS